MNPIKMIRRYINMPLKKALPLLFICAILLVGITGCTESTNTGTNTGNNTNVGLGGGSSHVSLTINSRYKVPSIAGSYGYVTTPAPGNIFAIYNVTVIDLDQNGILVSPTYFKLTTSDGSAYQYSSHTFSLPTPFDSVSNVQPGEKVTGSLAFEISLNKSPARLTYNDQIYRNQVIVDATI